MRLFILLVLSILAVSVNCGSVHKFDHFTIRNTADQSCFVYVSGTTDDSTQTDLNKCKEGCGGSVKVIQAKNSNQYVFSHFNGTDCTGDATITGGFKCPDPSIEPVKVTGTDFTIKCGTNPKSRISNDADTIEDTNELDATKPNGGNSKPKSDGNEISGFSDDEEGESGSTAKTKKPKSAQNAAGEEGAAENEDNKTKDDGNSAASNIASLTLILLSLIATLTL